jgi:molybdopterin converting factor small subunit
MSTLVKIAPVLQEQLQIPDTVEVQGKTIGECLDDLIRQYPEIQGWLFDANELLRVLISINNEAISVMNTKSHLDRVLNPDDEIRLLAIYAGG